MSFILTLVEFTMHDIHIVNVYFKIMIVFTSCPKYLRSSDYPFTKFILIPNKSISFKLCKWIFTTNSDILITPISSIKLKQNELLKLIN